MPLIGAEAQIPDLEREAAAKAYSEKLRVESIDVPNFFTGPNVSNVALEQVMIEAKGDISRTSQAEWGSFKDNVLASLSESESTNYAAPDNTTLVVLTNEQTRNREDPEITNRRIQGLKRGNKPGTVVVESTHDGVAVTALGWGPYEAQTEIGRIKGMEDLSAEQIDGLINSRALPTIRLEFKDKTMTKTGLEKMAERARISAKIKATENMDFDLKNENPREAFLKSLGFLTNKINKGDTENMPLPKGFTARSNGNPGELEIADSNYIGNEDAARIIIKTGITSEGAPGKNYTTDVLGVGIKMGNRIIRIDLNNKEDVQKIIGYLRPNLESSTINQNTEEVQEPKDGGKTSSGEEGSGPKDKAPETPPVTTESTKTNERDTLIEQLQKQMTEIQGALDKIKADLALIRKEISVEEKIAEEVLGEQKGKKTEGTESARDQEIGNLNNLTQKDLALMIGIKKWDGKRMRQIYTDYDETVQNGGGFKSLEDFRRIKNVGEKTIVKVIDSERIGADPLTSSIKRLLEHADKPESAIRQTDRATLQRYYDRAQTLGRSLTPDERSFMARDIRAIRSRINEVA